jgi:hypothetical protein
MEEEEEDDDDDAKEANWKGRKELDSNLKKTRIGIPGLY